MNKESGIGASGCDDALPMNNVRTVLTILFLIQPTHSIHKGGHHHALNARKRLHESKASESEPIEKPRFLKEQYAFYIADKCCSILARLHI